MKVLLVVYDNDSFIHWFPQGLAYIAAVLEQIGCEVTVYNQDIHHWPEEHLTRYLDENEFDVVGVSVIAGYYQYRKLLKISQAINDSVKRPFYIIGGHGPTPDPDFFFRKTGADVIVTGEGEETVVELLEAVSSKSSLKKVNGIAYREGGQTYINPRRTLIKDLDSIPFPAYHLFPIETYRLLRMPHCGSRDFAMPVLSGRGCTFRCSFCYRMDKGFRPRSEASIVEEIRLLQTNYGINYIIFSDELLMSSVARTESLCNAIIKSGLKFKWTCNGRLNYAKPDLLNLMKQAGCIFINYGIEAMDDEVLKLMQKGLRVSQVYKGIEATLETGISPGFNIIFGNLGDNIETLNKGVEFLLQYDDGAQMRTIRPVTPYPGSPLYYHAIEQGLLKNCEDFYDNKHTNSDLLAVNFTELSDDEFHAALFDANKRLLESYFAKKKEAVVEDARQLYIGRNENFRGFRVT